MHRKVALSRPRALGRLRPSPYLLMCIQTLLEMSSGSTKGYDHLQGRFVADSQIHQGGDDMRMSRECVLHCDARRCHVC